MLNNMSYFKHYHEVFYRHQSLCVNLQLLPKYKTDATVSSEKLEQNIYILEDLQSTRIYNNHHYRSVMLY